MRFIVPLLLLCAAAGGVEPEVVSEDLSPPERELPAVSLMPAGSVLTNVLIPRYDTRRQLTASLRAKTMTVVDSKTVEGRKVELKLYNPDRSTKGKVDLEFARFDQSKGVLESREPVEIVSKDLHATGAGIVYTYQQAQGFLIGPVKTRFTANPSKP